VVNCTSKRGLILGPLLLTNAVATRDSECTKSVLFDSVVLSCIMLYYLQFHLERLNIVRRSFGSLPLPLLVYNDMIKTLTKLKSRYPN
jgi:hypothetical protein